MATTKTTMNQLERQVDMFYKMANRRINFGKPVTAKTTISHDQLFNLRKKMMKAFDLLSQEEERQASEKSIAMISSVMGGSNQNIQDILEALKGVKQSENKDDLSNQAVSSSEQVN